MTTVTEKMIADAWAAIGKTKDGRIVRAYVAELLMDGPSGSMDTGAVYEERGRLKFARDIVRLLDAGLSASGQQPGDITILREPVQPGGPGGVRRRVPERE